MQKLLSDELGRPDLASHKDIPKLPVVVVLDNVRSALNVGSFFRTSDAFGISALYLCGITAIPPHKEIQKTAIGATESVDWHYYDKTTEAIQHLIQKGYHIIGVEHTDQSKSLVNLEMSMTQSYALVFGNEVDGISEEVIGHLNEAVEIKQYGTKHSLNVAVCGGIVIHEFSRVLRKFS
ncbi:MAG: RNA methyltransferase [Saprospiraceae bacterium]|nr:RNA methyltransferase [Saprospiraceae bacterium]